MRLCGSLADARTLRLELLEELRRMVPFDAYAWVLTDPETSVGSSPLADVPCLPELPRLIRLKYLTEVNRWTQLRTPVALLAESTKGELSLNRVWRELLHLYDIVDVASAVFRDGYGCWGFLELWRSSMSGQFTPREAAYLADISGPVTTASPSRELQGPHRPDRAWSGYVLCRGPRRARADRRDRGLPRPGAAG